MRLLLARHAQTGESYKGRYVGSTDVPICKSGYDQADQLAKRLSRYTFNKVFCSPMLRCCQSAEIICQHGTYGIETEPDLREIDFGRWERATFAEICKRDPQIVDQWSKDGLGFTFPEGENNQNFYERVCRVLDKILDCPEETVLVVSHGGVIRVMICILLGLDFKNYLLFNVKPATFVALDVHGDSAILSGFNL